MGLEKAILHNKEHRKPYKDSRRFDHSCRNHGSCDYCFDNRTFFHKKREAFSIQDLKEYKNELRQTS
jgi:hypothetical protein